MSSDSSHNVPPGRTIAIAARAKLNLSLLVGPRIPAGRPTAGYHQLASLMTCIALHDEISIVALPAGRASRYAIEWAADAPRRSPIDWSLEKDLAVRAHRALEQSVGRVLPTDLTVRKRIPVGGGLGGGSSDAAATLVGINAAFKLGLTTEHLMELGFTLGSDVPFLVWTLQGRGTMALVTGLGESVTPVPGRNTEQHVLLLVPPFGCATGEVYAALDRGRLSVASPDFNGAVERFRAGVLSGGDFGVKVGNDLATPAMTVEPRIQDLFRLARDVMGRAPTVTGSGSTLFVPHDRPTLERAAKELVEICQHRARRDADRSGWMADVRCVLTTFL